MPGSDFVIVTQWWTTLFLFGAVAFPLTRRLFSSWYDQGYFFSKAVGFALITWLVYAIGTLKILPFTNVSIGISMILVFVLGFIGKKNIDPSEPRQKRIRGIYLLIVEEAIFFGALLLWSWVKAHEPSLRGLEKFMDYGFMKSILESAYFPPPDMWYANLPINYYYFGHMVVAVLTKFSNLDMGYTFNLMLASIFAFTLTMSFSIGYQLSERKKWIAGTLTAFLVTLSGNMQTLYAFTKGYTGENVQPFWELAWGIGEFFQKFPEGLNTYWYANATRFIPFTIHEFPSYSFVVSDVHGHVLSIPFVLLAVALLIGIVSHERTKLQLGFYGFLVGVLLMTNALDGPIYFGLLGASALIFGWRKKWMLLLGILVVAAVTSLPFLHHFKSFVSGVALNCPPDFLANKTLGPLLFEGVEKCQKSPLWMMIILWGFFVYCGVRLLLKIKVTQIEKLLLIFFGFSILLIIFPEFFYFKDIYPAHFRSNTMFKLGYQAFMLFSIVSGYTIVQFFRKKSLFILFLIPQLFLVSIYPIFSVRSYFNSLRTYEGIYGLTWLSKEYPDDYAGLAWLETQTPGGTIVEADGDSYTDYNHFSAFSGRPSIVGWAVHEWLWRGGYEYVSPRRDQVREIYESGDPAVIQPILDTYGVRFIIVGPLEREKFTNLNEAVFAQLGRPVFHSGNTVIYEVGAY